jgi:predicted dehydrogenase
MSRFRAAVVGTGFIGPVHVEGLRRAGVAVVGILGSSPTRSAEAAAALDVGTAYPDYETLLRDDRVQVVHLTTPNRFHFDQASQALRAGKHVMCEKPLAMTAREAAALVSLARETALAAGVNYNIRYYPLCQEAAERVRQGHLGRVLHVTGSYVQDWLLYPTDFNWRVLADEGGPLRAVADIGTHWLDLVQFIASQPVRAVCADLQTVHAERQRNRASVQTFTTGRTGNGARESVPIDTEDAGAVLLQFASGARGVLWVSQTTAGRKNCLRFEVAGSTGSCAWDSERPNEMWLGRRDGANEVLLRDPSLLGSSARRFADYPGGHNEGFPDTFKQCFRDFYAFVAAGDPSATRTFPTFEDGCRELLLCEAILESHRQRRWVSVSGGP